MFGGEEETRVIGWETEILVRWEVVAMAGRAGLPGQLCSEWADDQRMAVLFAPLRAKELNPESWNSKVNFWSSLVVK